MTEPTCHPESVQPVSADAAPRPVTLGIINYNGLRFLPELLEGIGRQQFTGFETVLIDNHSTDDSLSYVQDRHPAVRVIASRENLGFSKAANRLLRESASPLVGFLNPDLKLHPDWLGRLVEQISENERRAAVAPKMLLYDSPDRLNGVGGCMNRLGYTWDRGMFEEDVGQYDEPARVLFASAGASLFRRSALLQAGGFDEGMFMYHEDVDLGWRLWLYGYEITTAPGAVAWHHFGGTTRAHRGLQWREVLGERHNIRSLLKNYQAGNLLRALAALAGLRQPMLRKIAQARNFGWNLVRLPSTLRLRLEIQRRRLRSDRELEALIVQSSDVPVRL